MSLMQQNLNFIVCAAMWSFVGLLQKVWMALY